MNAAARPLQRGYAGGVLRGRRVTRAALRLAGGTPTVGGMLALALAAALQVPPADSVAAPDTAAVVPVSQVLALELDPSHETWTGSLRAKLTVRRETRSFALRLTGPDPTQVELATEAGAVPLTFGRRGRDSLLIETMAPLVPGAATLTFTLAGAFAVSGPGLRRPDARHAIYERGAGNVVPQWPAETPVTPWRLSVRAPATSDVIASLPRATRSLQRDWSTWEFTSGGPVPADSLRVEVRPWVPHPVRRRGSAVNKRPRRR